MAVNLLVLGAGNIFQAIHLPAIAQLGITITAVVEPSEKVREQVKPQLPSAQFYNSLAEVDLTNITHALVATPAGLHYGLIKQLHEKNIHILCEKPVAVSATQANEIAGLYTGLNSPVLQIGFQRRYNPANQYIASLIKNKTYGNLNYISVWGGWIAKNTLPQTILNKNISGGGILLDYGVHFIDLLLYWCNNVELLNYYDDSEGGVEVNAVAAFKLGAGQLVEPVAKLYLSWTSPMSNTIQLVFDDAMVVSGINIPNSLEIVLINNQFTDIRRVMERETITLDYSNATVLQWKEFIASTQGNAVAIANLQQAVTTVNVVEKCYSNRKKLKMDWGL